MCHGNWKGQETLRRDYSRLDRRKALEHIKKDPYILEGLNDELKDDYDLVSLAVSLKPYTLGSASESLRNNPNIAIEAIRQNPNAARYIGDQLKSNYAFMSDACKISKDIIELIEDEKLKERILSEQPNYGQIGDDQ